MTNASVVSVHIGRVAPLGRTGQPSAFRKAAVAGAVAAGPLGLAGDEQADRRVHGGVDKAVYGYGTANYAAWAAEFPALTFGPGCMGENLALAGLDEDSVCIGDRHRIGSALLEVCQPRQPCATLILAFDEPLVTLAMTRTGRSGWYYRVVEPGMVASGGAVTLEARANPEWSVRRFVKFMLARNRSADDIAAVMAMPGLARQWQAKAATWRPVPGGGERPRTR